MSEVNVNRIVLVGSLLSDPEYRDLPASGSVCFFHLECPAGPGASNSDDSHSVRCDVLVLGKHAKRIAPDLYRGCRVVLEGRLEHTSWEAHDGSERESVCVIAVRVQPLDARSADARSAQAEPAVDPSSGSTGRRAAVRGLS